MMVGDQPTPMRFTLFSFGCCHKFRLERLENKNAAMLHREVAGLCSPVLTAAHAHDISK